MGAMTALGAGVELGKNCRLAPWVEPTQAASWEAAAPEPSRMRVSRTPAWPCLISA
jgi:hypothetical protein